ncbi:crAss001_48 related protein [Undibacterium sp. SXout7W]|uniref:crAss001_48 related protein n=1 Tax=Undibacterium sp. SXout7W TaxID=3413049 RepID=UPI003BF22425
MQTYIGTKIINAKPMTRGDYNQLRDWTVPADENPNDEGFLVEYLDGGKANVEGFKGYVSWSPKPVFEQAYVCVGSVEGLQPHQQRVAAEYSQLWDRVAKLNSFILTSPHFPALPEAEQARLERQRQCMSDYAAVLLERISAFSQ